MMNLKFNLNETLEIAESGEHGLVIGKAAYVHAESSYLLRYKSADGRAVEQWWTESALKPYKE